MIIDIKLSDFSHLEFEKKISKINGLNIIVYLISIHKDCAPLCVQVFGPYYTEDFAIIKCRLLCKILPIPNFLRRKGNRNE